MKIELLKQMKGKKACKCTSCYATHDFQQLLLVFMILSSFVVENHKNNDGDHNQRAPNCSSNYDP